MRGVARGMERGNTKNVFIKQVDFSKKKFYSGMRSNIEARVKEVTKGELIKTDFQSGENNYTLKPLINGLTTILFKGKGLDTIESILYTFEALFSQMLKTEPKLYNKKDFQKSISFKRSMLYITSIKQWYYDFLNKCIIPQVTASLKILFETGVITEEEISVGLIEVLFLTSLRNELASKYDSKAFATDVIASFEYKSMFEKCDMLTKADSFDFEDLVLGTKISAFVEACYVAMCRQTLPGEKPNYKGETLEDLVKELCGEDYLKYVEYLKQGVTLEWDNSICNINERLTEASDLIIDILIGSKFKIGIEDHFKEVKEIDEKYKVEKKQLKHDLKQVSKSCSVLEKVNLEKDRQIEDLKNKLMEYESKIKKDNGVSELQAQVDSLNRTVKSYENKLASANNRIKTLEDRLSSYNDICDKNKDLQTRLDEANMELELVTSASDDDISVEDIRDLVKDKRFLFIGGPIGYDKRLETVFNNFTFIDIHSIGRGFTVPDNLDCVVIYNKINTHSHVGRLQAMIDSEVTPVIKSNVTNLDLLLKLIYHRLSEKGCL